ncbi:MAG TPA: hypothetical protein PKC65_01885 [Pyrinomonadaceae bacterium]|nr:hypothetical protein [Pyrinomonadaceae bacterium]
MNPIVLAADERPAEDARVAAAAPPRALTYDRPDLARSLREPDFP